MTLESNDFDRVGALVRARSSIVLTHDNRLRVEMILQQLAQREGLATISELVRAMESSTLVAQKVVEAVTINETMFFRDRHPFEVMAKHVIPEIMAARTVRRLNIWSAACSSGQEPYSIAMTLAAQVPALKDWYCQIVATDISEEMLARAKAGVYNQNEISRGLPSPYLLRFFQKQGLHWQVNDDVRQMVRFFSVNLGRPWPPMPHMDVVFLRNVLIYFDMPTRTEILRRLRGVMSKGGFVFLGTAESPLHLDDAFEMVKFSAGSCFRLRQ